MAANVRCAGRPVEIIEREAPTEYDVEPSCGWTGQAQGLDAYVPYEVEGVLIIPADLMARLHCPSCGGPVELIPPATVYDDPGDEQLDLQLDEAFFDPGGEPE